MVRRDISLTRTNMLANKSLSGAEEETLSQRQLTMDQQPMNGNVSFEHPMQTAVSNGTMRTHMSPPIGHISHMGFPSNGISAHSNAMSLHNTTMLSNNGSLPMRNGGGLVVYNKNGWHEGFADRSFYDNTTDIYPESNTTTRSSMPFIVESPKHSPTGVVSPLARAGTVVMTGSHMQGHMNQGQGHMQGHDTISRSGGAYLVDGRGEQMTGNATYMNGSAQDWRQDGMEGQEPDLVLF